MNIADLNFQQCFLPQSSVLIAVWVLSWSLSGFISGNPDDMCNLLLMHWENVILNYSFPHVCFTDD